MVLLTERNHNVARITTRGQRREHLRHLQIQLVSFFLSPNLLTAFCNVTRHLLRPHLYQADAGCKQGSIPSLLLCPVCAVPHTFRTAHDDSGGEADDEDETYS